MDSSAFGVKCVRYGDLIRLCVHIGSISSSSRYLGLTSSTNRVFVPDLGNVPTSFRPSVFRIESPSSHIPFKEAVRLGDIVVLVDPDTNKVWNNKSTGHGYYLGFENRHIPGEIFVAFERDDKKDGAYLEYGQSSLFIRVKDSHRFRTKFNQRLTKFTESKATQGFFVRSDGWGIPLNVAVHPVISVSRVKEVSIVVDTGKQETKRIVATQPQFGEAILLKMITSMVGRVEIVLDNNEIIEIPGSELCAGYGTQIHGVYHLSWNRSMSSSPPSHQDIKWSATLVSVVGAFLICLAVLSLLLEEVYAWTGTLVLTSLFAGMLTPSIWFPAVDSSGVVVLTVDIQLPQFPLEKQNMEGVQDLLSHTTTLQSLHFKTVDTMDRIGGLPLYSLNEMKKLPTQVFHNMTKILKKPPPVAVAGEKESLESEQDTFEDSTAIQPLNIQLETPLAKFLMTFSTPFQAPPLMGHVVYEQREIKNCNLSLLVWLVLSEHSPLFQQFCDKMRFSAYKRTSWEGEGYTLEYHRPPEPMCGELIIKEKRKIMAFQPDVGFWLEVEGISDYDEKNMFTMMRMVGEQRGDNTCMLTVSCEIKWVVRSMVAGIIERSVKQGLSVGYNEYFKLLVTLIRNQSKTSSVSLDETEAHEEADLLVKDQEKGFPLWAFYFGLFFVVSVVGFLIWFELAA